jgi:hypothetical protein
MTIGGEVPTQAFAIAHLLRLAFALALVGRVKRQRHEALLGQALGEHHEAHPRAERRPH